MSSFDSRESEGRVLRHALPLLLLWGCSLNVSGLQVSHSGRDGAADGAWAEVPFRDATTIGSGGILGSGGVPSSCGTVGGGTTTMTCVGDSGGAPAGQGGSASNTATSATGGATGASVTSSSGGSKSIDTASAGGGSGGASSTVGGLGGAGTGGVASLGGTVSSGGAGVGSGGTGGVGGVSRSGGTTGSGGNASSGGTSGCLFGPFRTPEPITGLGLGIGSMGMAPSLSADGKTLYFAASAGFGPEDIYVATRSGRGPVFSPATALSSVNTSSGEGTPFLSHDGLTLYFYSDHPGGRGGHDIWFASRASAQGTFGAAKPLTAVNTSAHDHLPWVSVDELTLVFSVSTADGSDITIATRTSRTADFSAPTALGSVNTPTSREDSVALSSDGLTIYFSSNRPGGLGARDTWVGTRSSASGAFTSITNLGVVNSVGDEMDVKLSYDGTELVFVANGSLYRSIRDCQ